MSRHQFQAIIIIIDDPQKKIMKDEKWNQLIIPNITIKNENEARIGQGLWVTI